MGAIVIGGTGQLGRVLCRVLAARGTRVGFTYFRDEATARELEAAGAVGVRLDLGTAAGVPAALDALAAKLDRSPTSLIYAAAIASGEPSPIYDRMDTVTEEAWDRIMAVNVKGAFFCVRHFAKSAPRGSNVVLLGSTDGEKSVPSPPPYATTKAALSGLARSLSKELGPRGITINVVAPGLLESGASAPVPESVRTEYLKHSASKRYGKHQEVADFVAWLALDNTYVTGRTLLLDGGL
jgi:NAD(P)-dependent dehydrogenase (short-subunit alcohol dehydrogenase family)